MKQLTVVFLLGIATLAEPAQPGGVSSPVAIVPFEMVLNHLYVQASVNNSPPLSVVVDSGTTEAALDRSRSIQLALPASGAVLVPGFGNEKPTAGQKVVISRISLYGITLDNVVADSVPLDVYSQLLGHTTDAIIGSELFNKYVVEVDYPERVLRFYDPDNYVEPKEGCKLPLILDTYPMVHAQLIDSDEKPIDAVLAMDTGSSYVYITKLFGDAHPSLPLGNKTIDAAPRKMLSGVTRFRAGRVRAINLGGCIVEKPIVAFSQDVGGIGAGKRQFYGTIGMNVLQHFTTVFDYQHHLVALKKNGNGNEVPQYDMTGIHVLATGSSFHDFTVDYVLTNSPAARKDIRIGDRIESANHTPASKLTLDDLGKLFARAGSLRLTVSRNGRELKKKLKLKPMI